MNNTELPETRRFPIKPVSKAQEIWLKNFLGEEYYKEYKADGVRYVVLDWKCDEKNRPVAMLSFYLQCPSGQLKWHGYLRYKVDWAIPEFYCWIKISPRQRTWKTGIIYKLPEESAND